MTIGEKVELAIIPIVGIAVLLMAQALPTQISIARLLLDAAALLLLQSLVRDLWLLRRRSSAPSAGRRAARCMCVESTIGASGVAAGALLIGIGFDQAITIDSRLWSALAVVVLGTGFAIKDYVIEWNPWRIRKDKDHINIVFTWKS